MGVNSAIVMTKIDHALESIVTSIDPPTTIKPHIVPSASRAVCTTLGVRGSTFWLKDPHKSNNLNSQTLGSVGASKID